MNKDIFDKLDKKRKDLVLDEALKLFSLIEHYPIAYDDLEQFAKWVNISCKHGQELKDFLAGIYPPYGKQELKYNCFAIYNKSEKSLEFVKNWNEIIKKEVIREWFNDR